MKKNLNREVAKDKIVVAMMVKNEEARIRQTTLQSIKDYSSTVIIYDTGSTDNTIEVIKEWCIENGLSFHCKLGEFVDFSTSRNILLDFCDEVLAGKEKYLLLLDAHDELQNGDVLLDFVSTKEEETANFSGFYLTQRWLSGSAIDSYFNVRMVKSGRNWRYKGVVHEYISCLDSNSSEGSGIYKLDGVYLYQDRTADDDKSAKRFARDKDLLYKEYLKNPHESRTLFYLAQTCGCLGQNEEAYKYYLLRIKEGGFNEEIYHALYRLGDTSVALGHSWEESMTWYLKAFQHSQRAEPLVRIATYYKDNNLLEEGKSEWHTCYMFSSMACQLIYPINQFLFVNKKAYTYDRWHLLGISAYYVGKYDEGRQACIKAIEAENKPVDRSNLRFYIQKDLELSQTKGSTLSCPLLISASWNGLSVKTVEEEDKKYNIEDQIKSIIDEHKIEVSSSDYYKYFAKPQNGSFSSQSQAQTQARNQSQSQGQSIMGIEEEKKYSPLSYSAKMTTLTSEIQPQLQSKLFDKEQNGNSNGNGGNNGNNERRNTGQKSSKEKIKERLRRKLEEKKKRECK